MKYKILVLVTVENDIPDKKVSEREAKKAIKTFINIKNQLGCEVSGNKITFEICD